MPSSYLPRPSSDQRTPSTLSPRPALSLSIMLKRLYSLPRIHTIQPSILPPTFRISLIPVPRRLLHSISFPTTSPNNPALILTPSPPPPLPPPLPLSSRVAQHLAKSYVAGPQLYVRAGHINSSCDATTLVDPPFPLPPLSPPPSSRRHATFFTPVMVLVDSGSHSPPSDFLLEKSSSIPRDPMAHAQL